jgi:pimeloyl-ACP methyl ester carboxylesterase
VLDYLETVPEVDATKVAVIGHSRGGKTALWAAATDPRFAMAISNDSGCGGASLSRRTIGETVKSITTEFNYWFCDRFDTFAGREQDLPVDQHQLIALIAPRAVAIASADEDLWADPRGEFLALCEASPVYALYGQAPIKPDEMPGVDGALRRGNRSYHIRTGKHDLTGADWGRYLDFADAVLK